MKYKTKIKIIAAIVYIGAFASMLWIDVRLIIPFMLFGWAMNIENKNK